MTQEEFKVWMAAEDQALRDGDWDHYVHRGMMELLTPVLKAKMGPEMADYLQEMEDYILLRNWSAYEAGRTRRGSRGPSGPGGRNRG